MKELDDAQVDYRIVGDEKEMNASTQIIILDFNGNKIEFYPHTGTWIVLKPRLRSRGIKNLLRYLDETKVIADAIHKEAAIEGSVC